MATKRLKVAESGVQKACLDLLAAEKIWHRRWNTGAVKTGDRFFRFGQKGDADILFTIPNLYSGGEEFLHVRDQLVCWIECKSDSGKQTSEQHDFQYEVEAQGHMYLLIRDVADLQKFLKANR
jgi:hypothetical protein